MDLKRNVLIAAIAIVSYLMLLAWNEDYPQGSASIEEASVSINKNNTDMPGSQSLPSVNISTIENNSSEDLPQITSTVQAQVQGTQSVSLINVKTPVHEINIDLKGGDIVGLSLPKYPTTLETPDDPFVLLRNDNAGTYIAQSFLLGRNGLDANPNGRPLYKSSQSKYILTESGSELNVDLTFTDANNVSIIKRYIFSADDYLIKMQYIINNQSEEVWRANLAGQIKRDNSDDPTNAGGMGMRSYFGASLTTPDDHHKKLDFDDIDDGGSKDTVTGGWIGFSQHYFLGSWIPNSETSNTYSTRKNSNGDYILDFVTPETIVAVNTTQTIEADFWGGPKDQYRLKEISPNLDLTVDYKFLWFVAKPIFWLLTIIQSYVGNYGWSIIGLTIVIKTMFSWLSASSYRSMAKMRRLAPKIQQLKDRYGDDKQKIMQEQMALWKKEKVNPLGGCLPMLLQMPVLIGIYWVLNESVELRQAPFILWYDDLSVMDPYFLLPIVMGVSMFISQSMTPMTTADPMQAKVMKLMPVIFTVFFLWFPSGLVLYWLVGNIFNITQQWWINKKVNESYENKTN